MLRLTMLLLAVFALPLGACGGSGSKSSTVSGSTGSTGTSQQPAAGAAKGPSGRSAPKRPRRQVPAPATATVSFTQKSFFGAKSQVTYFVARRGGRSALAQAKDCVQANLRKAPSAYCFAFASERSFRFSQISPRPPAKIKRPCWIAYWGKPSGRRPIGSASNGAAVPLHCPGATG